MSTEDFFIDGKTQKMFVLVSDGDPSSYFYFPAEFTLPKIIKWKDIEPARLHMKKIGNVEYEIALTRIHYWCLVIWINPKKFRTLDDNKPVIAFSWNFHTPYLFKDNHASKRFDIRGGRVLNWDEKIALGIAMKTSRVGARWSPVHPIPYPGIAKETKPTIINGEQRFGDETIESSSVVSMIIGDHSEVTAISSDLTGTNSYIAIDGLRKFLRTLRQSVSALS